MDKGNTHDNEYIEATLKEILSVAKTINDRIGTLEYGYGSMVEGKRKLVEHMTQGFREVNKRLNRIESKVEATGAAVESLRSAAR